jgi:hypothetical protein
MKQHGLPPNVVHYSAALNAVAKGAGASGMQVSCGASRILYLHGFTYVENKSTHVCIRTVHVHTYVLHTFIHMSIVCGHYLYYWSA